MNKKIIWGIVGLTSFALLGIVYMQSNWIRQSIKLNQEQFDKNVYAALKSFSKKLEQLELSTTAKGLSDDPNSRLHLDDEFFSVDQTDPNEQFSESGLDLSDPFQQAELSRFRMEEVYRQVELAMTRNLMGDQPIEDRITDIGKFEELLINELSNVGIRTDELDFNYGIWSYPLRKFVFTQQYNCDDLSGSNGQSTTAEELANTEYRVQLFQADYRTAGYLMIVFPGKEQFVLWSVLPYLLATLLLSSIVLGCFAYTISVIFRQKQLSEIKTDFINNMTHEFKTPIATISLASDSIINPVILNNPDKVKRFAVIIKDENKRMNSQVEKVLQMALLDKKDFKINLKMVNVHSLIEKAVNNVGLQVEKKNGQISKHLESTNPLIEADETHLSNVIHNLMDNANKYSADAPFIDIYTRTKPNGIEIEVADKGIGIDSEARKRIFDKFYRVHTGNRHDVKGFGLGLSYVKAIVTAHKGHIQVKSELGKGSSFILFFPFHVVN